MRKFFGILLWVIMAIMLLPTAVLLIIYSQWGQDSLRTRVLDKLNQEKGIELRLDSLSLRFPLKLDLKGLALVQYGDTMIAASSAQLDVKLMPLLAGKVSIEELRLAHARYQMGNADSLSMMLIEADTINASPASVALPSMHIVLDDGYISGGRFALSSKVDTVVRDTPADTTSQMRIEVKHLALRDFRFDMSIQASIDSLAAAITDAKVEGVDVDLHSQKVLVHDFRGSGLSAACILPDSAQIADAPVAPPSPPSAPWTVEIDSINFTDSKALYTTHGLLPQPGLDFSYIQLDSLDLAVHDLYNQATTLKLPISLHGHERCGVWLDASGTFDMDSLAMRFIDFNVKTPYSSISADGLLGMGDMTTDDKLPMSLATSASLGIPDIKMMFPVAQPYLAAMAPSTPIKLNIDLSGTAGHLNIKDANLKINNCMSLDARGIIDDMFASQGPSGNIALSGQVVDVDGLLHSFLEPGSGLAIPPMTLDGKVAMRRGDINANLDATTLGGKLALAAKYQAKNDGYDISLNTHDFPLQAFITDMDLGPASINLQAHGNGFDLFNAATNADASLQVAKLVYGGYPYHDIQLIASLHDGNARINADASSSELTAVMQMAGNLDGKTYDWTATLDGQHIDLYALHFSETPAVISMQMSATASASDDLRDIAANAILSDFSFEQEEGQFQFSNVKAAFNTTDSITSLSITNRDLHASADFPCGLDSLLARFDAFNQLLDHQLVERRLNPDSLQRALPRFTIYASSGGDNFINDILSESKMSIAHLLLDASNDSVLHIDSELLGLRAPTYGIDTMRVELNQIKSNINLLASIDNRPGTLDEWAHLKAQASLNANKMGLRVTQRNIHNIIGYDLGADILQVDSTATLEFTTLAPIIAYKPWTINSDNYISYNFPHKQIDANLYMQSDKSALKIYSASIPIGRIVGNAHNDIAIELSRVNIADWIQLNPFAPPITGQLSADMRIKWSGGTEINGDGVVNLDDLYYDKQRVGSFATNLDVKTNTTGMIRASANLLVDDKETMRLSGVLNDSTTNAPFDLDLDVIKFPLRVANPFLPADVAQLSGSLNGSMCLAGESDHLRLNGEIYFDQAAVKAAMTNTSYGISDVKIPVEGSVVKFNKFGISGTNENPLLINGQVDLRSIIDPKWDLILNANNMMIVNSNSAAKNAEIFGKGYIDLEASVRGNTRFTKIGAKLSVLSGTNVTYVMNFASSTLTSSTANYDMVKFVNFNDTELVQEADSVTQTDMLMAIDASLDIQSGVSITVDLPTGARDKVQLQPQGILNYSQEPLSEGRLTGRIVINNGMARYTLPVIGGEKAFTIDQGSYIAFNGDMLNPQINLHAVDVVKANVVAQGQNSRMVNFNVLLGVTGSLNAMDVKFDLSTNDDITVANELQSMSPEQRANQAMNMLLYGTYTGPGIKTSGNNPLFSFLTSKVNDWAANNIKGVDLSFGIDQYDDTRNGSTSSQMTYSYQVSKTLFNDRFKIVVGGNYSTSDNPEENLSENLINDISFEYFLNKQQTMVLKLFRHTGYESILEGEVTQTGVGFVYRRKMGRLSMMLPKFMRPKRRKSDK